MTSVFELYHKFLMSPYTQEGSSIRRKDKSLNLAPAQFYHLFGFYLKTRFQSPYPLSLPYTHFTVLFDSLLIISHTVIHIILKLLYIEFYSESSNYKWSRIIQYPFVFMNYSTFHCIIIRIRQIMKICFLVLLFSFDIFISLIAESYY